MEGDDVHEQDVGVCKEDVCAGAASTGGFHLEVWLSAVMANRDVMTKEFFSCLNAIVRPFRQT